MIGGTTSRRLAALTVGALIGAAALAPGTTAAAGPQQVVFVNGVTGPDSVDVYVDGQLRVAGFAFGAASAVVTVPDQADHDLALFDAIANPPAAETSRSDTPLEAWSHSGMPRAGAFFHPDGPTVLRLANSVAAGRWYVFRHPLADSSIACTSGTQSRSFAGSADLFARGPSGGGNGIFGTGGSTSATSTEYDQPVVVMGDRVSGLPGTAQGYAFGSFDFGTVPFRVGNHYTYVSYGNTGSYGAAEVIVDCATRTITSTRSVARNPVFPSSKFVPLEPLRLFDTRTAPEPQGALVARSTLDVQVTGRVGIPASGVSAVVLNVTATRSLGPGFVTVFPTGAPRPQTSSLNVTGAGQTVPNLVTVPVGDDGKVSFYAHEGLDLLADVSGYFVEATAATAGRFVPLTPGRVFDTRKPPTPQGALAAGATITVKMTGAQGIPATGVSAVVLNVTGVGLGGPGFITAYPTGSARPDASNLNLAGAGDVAPNLVIAPLGDDGSVDFYARSDAHVLADVFGYFTDDSAASSPDGLFVPTTPVRVEDTRAKPWNPFGDIFIEADSELNVAITGTGDVPGLGAAAVLANVTATQSADRGFVTVYPSETTRPDTSNLNIAAPGVTRPNAVLVPLGGIGDITLYALSGTHAIVDVFGYFTG
jgi:hypothetical protein